MLLGAPLPLTLGGYLPVDDALMSHWGPATAWRLPVGDARVLGRPERPDARPFRLNRGLERAHGRVTHQGADLANGEAGDTVRAAGGGIVLLAQARPNGNGYGGHVVLAHRLEDGRVAYSVYAHLVRGSVCVRAGEAVCAGDPLGLVGRTGRASTPHLHFEVRVPDSPSERWEKAAVVDPIAFVEERLAEPPQAGEDGDRAYLDWARQEGLLPAGAAGGVPLTRDVWWRMLAGAAGPGPVGDADAPVLRDSLIEAGLLPEEQFGSPPAERLSWSELARDVKRLRQVGVCQPHGPLAAAAHATECERRFGESRPAARWKSLRRLSGDPTVTDACVLLADLAGPRVPAQIRPAGAPHAKRRAPRRPRTRR